MDVAGGSVGASRDGWRWGWRLALNDRGQLVGTLAGQEGGPDRAILWEIEDEGDPVPPDTGCVVANNWVHGRDGRAGEFLGGAWAVGSGHYLGAVAELTALRQAASDTWELVGGC